jgi:phosphotransferase system enzyme I (PtsP)
MVLAEMAELGAFVSEESGLKALHQQSILIRGSVAQEGATKGNVWLHEPRVVVTNLVSDDPEAEVSRLEEAVQKLRNHVDGMLEKNRQMDKEQAEILEAYKMFANSRGWMKRMVTDINSGLSAEAAVDKEQSSARARLGQATDPYMRDRLHDLDDLSNRLLRILTGQGKETGASMPQNPILVASNIGPAELLDYGRSLKGIVLEEGSVGSHATIVARALAIPLVIHAQNITAEALNGDEVLVDGEQGLVHLRPDESVSSAFKDKIAMEAKAQERYSAIRHLPANTLDQSKINLLMNAGLMADLPSLDSSGAEGVGLFRTELQFLIRNQMPKRSELSAMYKRVMDAAGGKTVVFRSLDIGSDKVLSYMPNVEEPNPALGWRAIRVGLDKPGVLRMQLQALLRAAEGRPLSVMFPFIAQASEFNFAKLEMEKVKDRELKLGHKVPKKISLGAMLETPSLAYESQSFFQEVDFLSIGGNDLKQFFFAADRENELVRKRYDTLNLSFIDFLQMIVEKCKKNNTNLSFCGEDAGRPVEALCLAAIGIKTLSMRPASIGPVKNILLRSDLGEVRKLINNAKNDGEASVRKKIVEYMSAG